MAEHIFVTGKKISSMELVTNITGNEKIPTGQQDDLAITPNQIADYTIARGSLVNRDDLLQVEGDLGTQVDDLARDLAAEEAARIAADNLKVDKEGSVSSVAGRVGDVALAPSDVLVEGFGSQETVNKYVPKPFLSDYTYGLGERVFLDDGEVVKSLVDGNVGNPNVDMTGWVSTVSDSLSDTIQTFNTPEAGVDTVTGVADGTYFNVRLEGGETLLAEYQNIGGVPTPTGKSYPSSEVVEMSRDGVNTIADLLVIQNRQNGMRIDVKGYHAPTLFVEANPYKGGGAFVWDAASTATPDNGIVFAVDGVSTGRWIRQLESDGVVTPQMFGAKATGLPTGDDYPAIMAAINYASSSQGTNTVYFQKGKYYSSETINLKKPVNLIGESVGQNIGLPASSSVIYFAQGKDGIVVNGYRSLGLDQPVQVSTTRANGTQIKGLALTQYGYNNRSRFVVDYNPTTQHFITGRKPNLPVGSVIVAKDNRLREKARATITSYTITYSTMTVKALNPSLSIGDTITGVTSGATGTVAYISPNYNAFSISDITGSFLADEILSSPVGDMQALVKSPIEWASYGLTNVSGTIDIGDVFEVEGARGCGIVLLDRGVVDQCLVDGFPDNGLYITSTAFDAVAMNANGNKITSSAFIRNGRHGIITQGSDGNASEILGCDASLNTGYGVYDESFLGNYYFGCHTASNGVGAYYSRQYNNFSVFSGCYSEGSSPRTPFANYESRFGRDTIVIGATHGASVGGSQEGVGTTSLRGGYLQLSNAMYSEAGVNSVGVLNNTISFRNTGATTETIELCLQGSRSTNRGAGVVFNMPFAAAPFKSNNSDLIRGGKASVSWLSAVNNGTVFAIDLTQNEAAGSLLQFSVTPSNTTSGNGAAAVPIISGGVITGLDFKNFGKTYTEAPVITGTGSYAGFTATTEISNGSIVDYTITSPATATDLKGYNLYRALNVTVTSTASGLDNVAALGTAANRWSQVYAGTGTINTSDEREKQQVRDLSDAEKRVAVKLKSQIKAFKFNDAVAEKGDKARIHFGVIAQEVKAAFESEGLVAEDYAILCYDEWDAEYREITEEITVTNDAGEEVTETVETGERELIREAGNRYGVRYEELLAFIISAL